jgi:hypothetical protein
VPSIPHWSNRLRSTPWTVSSRAGVSIRREGLTWGGLRRGVKVEDEPAALVRHAVDEMNSRQA